MTQQDNIRRGRKSALTKVIATILVIAVGLTFVMSIVALIIAGI